MRKFPIDDDDDDDDDYDVDDGDDDDDDDSDVNVDDIVMKYRVFSRDVTAAMLMYPTNPPGIDLYYHADVFSCFGGQTRLLIT